MASADIIDSYFRDHTYPLTKHHIESYRQFLKVYIPNAIQTYNPITMVKNNNLKVQVYVGGKNGDQIFLDRPTYIEEGIPYLLTPQEARARNLTYQTNMYADIEVIIEKDNEEVKMPVFKRVSLGALPIMLHSDMCILYNQGMKICKEFGECQYDTGGYFIIDGKEKVIISQERSTSNRLIVQSDVDENFSHLGVINCTGETGEYALISKSVSIMMVKRPDPMWVQMKNIEHLEDYAIPNVKESLRDYHGSILVSIPGVSGMVPLFTLFRVLGIESDKMIIEYILGGEDSQNPEYLCLLEPSIDHAINDGRVIPRKSVIGATHGNPKPVRTHTDAMEAMRPYLTKQDPDSLSSNKELYRVLLADLFPNMPLAYEREAKFANYPMIYNRKAQFLGHIVREFLQVITGVHGTTDRDSYIYRRVDVSGILLSELFQNLYNLLRKNCRDELDRQYYYGSYTESDNPKDLIQQQNIFKFFPPMIIGEGFLRAMKGAWGEITFNEEDRKVQDLNRNSYLGYVSHMRRVKNPLDPALKVVAPHRLHCQQWGVMCPFESPDGANIGYVKNFAMLTHITFGSSSETIRNILPPELIMKLNEVSPTYAASSKVTRLFINGEWYAITIKPFELTRIVRLLRRNGYINPFVSISWKILDNEIRILTEPGRPTRPLFILEKGKLPVVKNHGWFNYLYPGKNATEQVYYEDYLNEYDNTTVSIEDMIKNQGVIEFLDIEEENTSMIAMTLDKTTVYHTHMEIDPSMIFSPITQHIPFLQHNSGPRNVFSAGQMKQAIGIYNTAFTKRFDPAAYIMHYPQKPIVSTQGAQMTGNDAVPNGFNCIVAVATYSGYNQEDSIIINKTAIDRGLFQITAYKSISATEEYEESGDPKIVFDNRLRLEKLGKNVSGGNFANYNLLGEDGIIKEESLIPRGQIAAVIGMVGIQKTQKARSVLDEPETIEKYYDASKVTNIHYYGTIDKVQLVNKGFGNKERICKVRFRKVRRPELGDKGVSRYAQKGVIGMIMPAEQMPFSKDGIIPDIIINPHSFPSRMCVAQMIESVFAKLCCLEGILGNGTVFIPFDHEEVYNNLQKHNYHKHGNEVLYNGATGEMMNADIFMGPTFYMRLKHMVLDKINYRGVGSNPATFMPFEQPREIQMLSPQDQMTRQPTAGRRVLGGLKIGEMERDVILSYGMSQFAKECMMEKADKHDWVICKHCGIQASYPSPNEPYYQCRDCGSQDIGKIQTPYAFKLFAQELESMGVTARLSQESFIDPDLETEPDFEEGSDVLPQNIESLASIGGGGIQIESIGPVRNDETDEEEEAEAEAEAQSEAEAEAEEDGEEDEDPTDILGDEDEDDEDDEDYDNDEDEDDDEDEEVKDDALKKLIYIPDKFMKINPSSNSDPDPFFDE